MCTQEKHTEGRPCEDTGRRWPSASQGRSRRGHQPCRHPDLRFLTSRTVTKDYFCLGVTAAVAANKGRLAPKRPCGFQPALPASQHPVWGKPAHRHGVRTLKCPSREAPMVRTRGLLPTLPDRAYLRVALSSLDMNHRPG